MSRLSTPAENAAVAAVTALGPYVGVNTADPTTTGASEVVYSSGTRGSVTWGAASAGAQVTTTGQTLNIPAGTTVGWASFWSLASLGVYGFGQVLSSTITFVTAGTLTFAVGAISESAT